MAEEDAAIATVLRRTATTLDSTGTRLIDNAELLGGRRLRRRRNLSVVVASGVVAMTATAGFLLGGSDQAPEPAAPPDPERSRELDCPGGLYSTGTFDFIRDVNGAATPEAAAASLVEEGWDLVLCDSVSETTRWATLYVYDGSTLVRILDATRLETGWFINTISSCPKHSPGR